jgi:hypothetical protein
MNNLINDKFITHHHQPYKSRNIIINDNINLSSALKKIEKNSDINL